MMFRSYRSKLQSAFLLVGLAAIAVTDWQASAGATTALRRATYDRLVAIRESRGQQLERYFDDARNHVLALSSDEATVRAVEEFRAAWTTIPPTPPGDPDTQRLRQHYQEVFASRVTPQAGRPAAWFPDDLKTRTLQLHYIVDNPHPLEAKSLLLRSPQGSPYDEVHERFHPTLFRYQSAFGFYDILLIDASTGRILYSVLKEIDLGVNLRDDPYRQTTLARAVRRAVALTQPEQVVIEDYAPYAASYFAPAAFVAAPVWRAGAKVGVLAIQIAVGEVNRVLTGGREWNQQGMGTTGQVYVVGPDNTLRSDPRPELVAALPDAVREQVRRNRTAVLSVALPEQMATQIRSAERGAEVATDLRGVQVLRSHAPLSIGGLDWTVVAEIAADEALEPVSRLRMRILAIGVVVGLLFWAASLWLANSVTRPVQALVAGVRRLGTRDFGARIPVPSDDEFGHLAATFNRMAEDLEQTTVSKGELDRTLGSLINAVLVIVQDPESAATGWGEARIRSANPAALSLLRYSAEELAALPLSAIVEDSDGKWTEMLERRLMQHGRFEAEEAFLRARDGRTVPVLFTAARLPDEPGKPAGIVCAAQDITARREAEQAVRQKQRQLEVLARKLLTAQEEERSRLARELHDDVTQRLASLAIEAGNIERLPPGATDRWRAGLDSIKRQLGQLSDDIHSLSRRLHPATLDDLGLVAAVESECRRFFERGGPPVELDFAGNLENLPRDTQLTIYRILQEALRNVLRHAAAANVSVQLRAGAEVLHLSIADDGHGFDRGREGWQAGLGLASMEERANLLGGTFSVASQPGHGTRIEVRLPLNSGGGSDGETDPTAGG
jgi:PAS domain S-box-containing protein